MSANRNIVRVEGFDSFRSFVDEWSKEKKGALYVYFSGSKDPETGLLLCSISRRWLILTQKSYGILGKSWCPDCVVAQPIVEKSFSESETTENSTLLYVGVGPRPGFFKASIAHNSKEISRTLFEPSGWKDPSCVFRVKEPKLKSVPTLIKWGTNKRLGDDQVN